MDPIVTASLLHKPIFFIAKSTVFGSPFQNWLLRQMHLIPIHRKEDNPDINVNNDDAFSASFKALSQGKSILIFPEGNSFNQRRLRKIKTGAARIALGAKNSQPESLDLRILPIGLNYSASTRFRSNVFVNVGEPIAVSDHLARYQKNEQEAVLTLTEVIRQRLEKLIIHTSTDEEDELAKQIEVIFKERLSNLAPIHTAIHEHDFILSKAILKSINYFNQTSPERVATLKKDVSSYLLQLKRLKLQDAVLGKGKKSLLIHSLLGFLYIIFGIPLYIYGLLHNYLPYIIPSKVATTITKEEEWYAPIMLTVGIFSFPIFYSLEVWLTLKFFSLSFPLLILYAISLPISGFFTLHYWTTALQTQEHWLFLKLFFKRQHVVEHLKQLRESILSRLELARQDYLQEREQTTNHKSDIA